MNYFDPRPKNSIRDFYDREEELHSLWEGIRKREPLILVLGLRRYGKTSLVLTSLEELKNPYLYIDCRLLPSVTPISPKDLAMVLSNAFTSLIKKRRRYIEKIRSLIGNIKGFSVAGLEVKVNISSVRYDSIIDFFEGINNISEHIVIVIDEAQELRRMTRYRFDSFLGYVYDHLDNITIILTGSEIGLLYKFLKINDPEAPLFGRAYREILLKPLDHDKARDFLIKGFYQENMNPPEWFIDMCIEKLDGVIGWLSYLGYNVVRKGQFTKDAIEEILEKASKMALEELEHFLELRQIARDRYMAILSVIASLGEATWSEAYRGAEARVGRIPKPTINNMLRSLQDSGFIEKIDGKYKISDPVLYYALSKK